MEVVSRGKQQAVASHGFVADPHKPASTQIRGTGPPATDVYAKSFPFFLWGRKPDLVT